MCGALLQEHYLYKNVALYEESPCMCITYAQLKIAGR